MSCVWTPSNYATTDLLMEIPNPKCHFAKNSQALDTIMRKLAGSKRGSWEVSSSVNIPFKNEQTCTKLPQTKRNHGPQGPIGRGAGAKV